MDGSELPKYYPTKDGYLLGTSRAKRDSDKNVTRPDCVPEEELDWLSLFDKYDKPTSTGCNEEGTSNVNVNADGEYNEVGVTKGVNAEFWKDFNASYVYDASTNEGSVNGVNEGSVNGVNEGSVNTVNCGSVDVDLSQVESVTQVEMEEQPTAKFVPNINNCEDEEGYFSTGEPEVEGEETKEVEEDNLNDKGDDLTELLASVIKKTAEFEDFVKKTGRVYEEDELKTWKSDTTILDKLFIGQEWACADDCRDYIKDQNIFQNFDIKQVKNTQLQQHYECKHKQHCNWNVYCSRIWDKVTFRCKYGDFEHTCETTHGISNPLAKARWVYRVMLDTFKSHLDYKPKNFIAEVKRVHSVEISYWTAWHAWHMCMERIFGNYEESYALAPECCSQILKRNEGSIASCATDELGKFKHICIAYKCSLDGFINGCRPILGLDGCFLKGKYGGVYLCIMSLDGNNGLFPVAIFLCRKEDKENWTEFLRIVAPFLKLHRRALTFISDREKGLVSAVDTNFSDVNHHHRFCFRHMYKNFKRYHPGKHLEGLAWNAARSYVEEDFKFNMDKMRDLRPQARTYLEKEVNGQWARAFFDVSSSCEHITSNFCEAFNAWILSLRSLPPCKFLEKYHLMVTRLMFDRRVQGETYEATGVVPRAEVAGEGELHIPQNPARDFEEYSEHLNSFQNPVARGRGGRKGGRSGAGGRTGGRSGAGGRSGGRTGGRIGGRSGAGGSTSGGSGGRTGGGGRRVMGAEYLLFGDQVEEPVVQPAWVPPGRSTVRGVRGGGRGSRRGGGLERGNAVIRPPTRAQAFAAAAVQDESRASEQDQPQATGLTSMGGDSRTMGGSYSTRGGCTKRIRRE